MATRLWFKDSDDDDDDVRLSPLHLTCIYTSWSECQNSPLQLIKSTFLHLHNSSHHLTTRWIFIYTQVKVHLRISMESMWAGPEGRMSCLISTWNQQEMRVGLSSARITLLHDSRHLVVISDHGDSEQVESCYWKGYKFIVSLAPLLLGISHDCQLFSSVSQPISPISKFRSKIKLIK